MAAWNFRVALLQQALDLVGAHAGMTARARVESAGDGRIVLRDIAYGSVLSADAAILGISLAGALRGQVDSLTLVSPRIALRARPNPEPPKASAAPPKTGALDAGGLRALDLATLPIGAVAVVDGEATSDATPESPAARIAFEGGGRLGRTPDIDITLAVRTGPLTGTGSIRMTAVDDQIALRASARTPSDLLSLPGQPVAFGGLRFDLDWRAARLDLAAILRGRGSLAVDAETLLWQGIATGPLALRLSAPTDRAEIVVTMRAAPFVPDASITIEIDRGQPRWICALRGRADLGAGLLQDRPHVSAATASPPLRLDGALSAEAELPCPVGDGTTAFLPLDAALAEASGAIELNAKSLRVGTSEGRDLHVALAARQAGAGGAAGIAIDARLRSGSLRLDALRADRMVATLPLAVQRRRGSLTLTTSAPASVGLSNLRADATELGDMAFRLAPSQAEQPVLTLSPTGRILAAHARIEHVVDRLDQDTSKRAAPALLAPLVAEIDLDRPNPGSPSLRGRLLLRDPASHVAIDGTVALEDGGGGTLALDLAPTRFAPDAARLADVSPLLAESVSDLAGMIEGQARASWTSRSARWQASLRARDSGFKVGEIDIAGLDGSVSLRSAAKGPAAAAELTARRIDAGIPFTQAKLTLSTTPDGVLFLTTGEARAAGGMVRLAEARLSGDNVGALRLQIDEVDLAGLLALAEVEGLAGTGRISGEIPMALRDGQVAIAEGKLAATAPGTLRYAPATAPAALAAAPANLVLQALGDFRYKSLTAKLQRDFGGDSQVALQIAGANPGFYDGYPVELNLNLTGKLAEILAQGLKAWQLPDQVQDMLERR